MNPTHAPLRLATGAFILNSGLSKLNADQATAEQLHGFASTAYPGLAQMEPRASSRRWRSRRSSSAARC